MRNTCKFITIYLVNFKELTFSLVTLTAENARTLSKMAVSKINQTSCPTAIKTVCTLSCHVLNNTGKVDVLKHMIAFMAIHHRPIQRNKTITRVTLSRFAVRKCCCMDEKSHCSRKLWLRHYYQWLFLQVTFSLPPPLRVPEGYVKASGVYIFISTSPKFRKLWFDTHVGLLLFLN